MLSRWTFHSSDGMYIVVHLNVIIETVSASLSVTHVVSSGRRLCQQKDRQVDTCAHTYIHTCISKIYICFFLHTVFWRSNANAKNSMILSSIILGKAFRDPCVLHVCYIHLPLGHVNFVGECSQKMVVEHTREDINICQPLSIGAQKEYSHQKS